MLSNMPLSPPFATPHSDTPPLSPRSNWLPWQFRVRPALVTTIGSIVAVLLAMGLLFTGRRLLGAISIELPPKTMLLTAFISAAAVTFSRVAWRRSFPLETPADLGFTDRLLGWGSSAALALLAVGCCYPANRTADWLIWLPILVADQFWRQNFFDAGEPWVLPLQDEINENITSIAMPQTASTQETTVGLSSSQSQDSPLQNGIVQQLYRLHDEQAGHEVIYGTVRADFVAGQRTAVVHVGFCPPLPYIPEIEAETLPGQTTRIKVVQALAHGTRLDVRLPALATDNCQVWIDLAARPAGAVKQEKIA